MNSMKNEQAVECRVSSVGSQPGAAPRELCPRPSPLVSRLAFTLVELLTVIAIIVLIAALIFPLASAVRKRAFIHNAQGQMAQIETAIENYKAAYGFYPPSSSPGYSPVTNQLYFELAGTMLTTNSGQVYYTTLDRTASILLSDVPEAFGPNVNGFMNCNKPGADEAAAQAQTFLPDLNTNQTAVVTVGNNNTKAAVLVTPLGGPEGGYNPMGTGNGNDGVNPWRYRYPGVNNPGSYDLWVQLMIGNQTNLICNWTKQVQVNNPSVQ